MKNMASSAGSSRRRRNIHNFYIPPPPLLSSQRQNRQLQQQSNSNNPASIATDIVTELVPALEVIDIDEYVILTEECQELVSTDVVLVLDEIENENEAYNHDLCSAPLSTFIGCANINEVDLPTDVTVIKGSLVFPYDLYLTADAERDESVDALEAVILRYLAPRLSFACENATDGSLLGLSSNPIDNIDPIYDECISDPPVIVRVQNSKCLPMIGEMTYYIANKDDAGDIESRILSHIEAGAKEGAFVSPEAGSGSNILNVILVDRTANISTSNTTLTTRTVDPPDNGGLSGPIIGAIVGGFFALVALVILTLVFIRRWEEEKKRLAEQEAKYPFDVSDWGTDSVPKEYAINRKVGVVYPKPPPSPDRTLASCDDGNDWSGWIKSFYSSEEP